MKKSLFTSIKFHFIGITIILYAITIPFFKASLLLSILPVSLLGIYLEYKIPWKEKHYLLLERSGDLFSLMIVWGLSIIQGQILLPYKIPLPSMVQPVLGIIIIDFFAYTFHRFSHHNKFLWKFHKVHHSRQSPTIFNTCYEHIADASFRLLGPGVILIFLGFEKDAILIANLTSTLFGIISHLNCKINIPRILQVIFITPKTHRMHHNQNRIDTNCGAITLIWDHIFGTFELQEMPKSDYGLNTKEEITNHPINIFVPQKIQQL